MNEMTAMPPFEQTFFQILNTKNWNNLLLRYSIRDSLMSSIQIGDSSEQNSPSSSQSEMVSLKQERQIVEYLHNLTRDQLIEFRYRVFKLVKDNFYEYILKEFLDSQPKPALKPLEHLQNLFSDIEQQTKNYPNNMYILKVNLIRDIVELIECLIANRSQRCVDEFPKRCTQFDLNPSFELPLGRENLVSQVNAIKNLHSKLIKHQKELIKLKQFTYDMEKMEKNFHDLRIKYEESEKENHLLKMLLCSLLVIFISYSFYRKIFNYYFV
jgi:hypothetical protein